MNAEVTLKIALEHGLTEAEFEVTKSVLGRTPNMVEIGIFSAMFSEHCSYKSSRIHLSKFPTEAEWVIEGPGENAGVIDIGGGMAAVFKMESHNHPSFIEPVEGAATGVGGILRDVFTMGARPIASLDALRFGAAEHERSPYLVNGVIKGISSYGNCIGVPTISGNRRFHDCYNGNILVNVMNVGVVRQDSIYRANASGVGNRVIYIGSSTGRDGIHGAVMASDSFGEGSEAKRPTVQVGDPFTEKLLLEACLELFEEKLVEGIQDMGAAGLTSSAFEMADRGNTGLNMQLDKVPQREVGMTPYELMLSESQERMLLVATPDKVERIIAVLKKWDLEAADIGSVEAHGNVKLYWHGKLVADMPVAPCVGAAPKYDRPQQRPKYLDEANKLDGSSIPVPEDMQAVFEKLLTSVNLCGNRWVTEQYDSMVGINSVAGHEPDAGVVRVKETGGGLAMAAGCQERFCYLDPKQGGKITVADIARKVACTGAVPRATTDCLNFGSPEKPEIMWQFAAAVDGLAMACNLLDVPVVSGNVSLYNQTGDEAIYPTPMIGIVGVLEKIEDYVPQFFSQDSHLIYLLGQSKDEIGGTDYLKEIHGKDCGTPPMIDLAEEKRLIDLLGKLAKSALLGHASAVTNGGLAIAIAKASLGKELLGARVELSSNLRADALLFGESQSRVILSFSEGNEAEVAKLCQQAGIIATPIGRVDENRFKISVNGKQMIKWDTASMSAAYHGSFKTAIFG